MHTSKQLLSFTKYSDLFPEDPSKAKLLLRRLQKEWHPDHNSNTTAHDVFIHIMKLYQMSNPVSYSGPEYTRMDGATARFKSVCSVVVSFCTVWYSDKNAVLLEFTDDSKFLIEYFKKNIKTVSEYIKSSKKDKYNFIIPDIYEVKNDNILIIKMPDKNFVPLQFVKSYIKQHDDYKLAFWIISRAFDISMLFDASNLVANGFIIPLCFVDLKEHRMIDLSAYFFASNDKLHALDSSQVIFYPQQSLTNKVVDKKADIALVKAFGLKLIGDNAGIGYCYKNPNYPDQIISFLSNVSFKNKLASYTDWQTEVSKKSFGKRQFHDLILTFSQLFNYHNGA